MTFLNSSGYMCAVVSNSLDCSQPDSSVPGVLQARILEWVAMPSSRGSSRPRIEPASLACPELASRSFSPAPPGKLLKSNRWTIKTNVLRKQHWNKYTIRGETDHQLRLDAWDGCSGLVHWEDPEGWDGEGGRRGDQDGEDMEIRGWFMSMYGKNHYNIVK